jgi:prepilin-type N-terminal cleavage/methylation domain-containing protein
VKRELQPRSERGVTLVEILIAVAVLTIVLLITIPLVTMLYDTTDDVQQTFTVSNQVLLASEVLTQYLHEAITPCPPTSSTCTIQAPYASPTSSSLTFYASTGNSNGPAEIVISVSASSYCGNAATLCVSVYEPTSGCPMEDASGKCSYPANPTIPKLINVQNLTNTSPLSYLTSDGAACPGSTNTTTLDQNLGSIVGVCLNLQAKLTRGQAVGYSTAAYALSSGYVGTVG